MMIEGVKPTKKPATHFTLSPLSGVSQVGEIFGISKFKGGEII